MKKQTTDLDHLFKSRLSEAEMAPPAEIWMGVESALKRRRRRRFAAIIWAFAGVTGVLVAAAWWHSSRLTGAQADSGRHSVYSLSASDALSAQQPSTATTITPSESGSIDRTAVVAPEAKPAFPTPKTTPGQVRIDDIRSDRTTITHSTAHLAAKSVTSPIDDASQPVSVDAIPASGEQSAGLNVPAAEMAERLKRQEPGGNITAVQSPALSLASISSTPVHGLGLSPRQPVLDRKIFEQKLKYQRPASTKKSKKSRHCYDFVEHPNVWLFDAYAGPDLVDKTLSATTPEMNTYAENRQMTETSSWAFNAGARARFLFQGRYFVSAGAHYDQITETFEHIDPDAIEYIIKQVYDVQTGSWVIDTIDISYGSQYFKAYNRSGMLDIPLEGGYEWRKGRTGLSLHGGASLNVLFWKRGTMLGPAGDPLAYGTSASGFEPYKVSAGWSLGGGVQWFWHANRRTRLFAEPHARWIMQPVTRADYPVRQRYLLTQLRFGVTRIL